MPAFINLQQYYAEKFSCERVAEMPEIDLRWRNKVVGLRAPRTTVRARRSRRRKAPIGSTPIR